VLFALALFTAFIRWRSGDDLRKRFGPEYDRLVQSTGSRQVAEKKLSDLLRRRRELDVRPLSADARRSYRDRWETLQTRFVDDPAGATRQAGLLVTEVMKTRGYPDGTFDTRAEWLSTDHPDVIADYREAHAASTTSAEAGTDELRTAFVHYRTIFGRLLSAGASESSGPARDSRDHGGSSLRSEPETLSAGASERSGPAEQGREQGSPRVADAIRGGAMSSRRSEPEKLSDAGGPDSGSKPAPGAEPPADPKPDHDGGPRRGDQPETATAASHAPRQRGT
jgi:hypothetical protein